MDPSPPTAPALPLIELPVRATSSADRDKLVRALTALAARDPALTVGGTDAEGWTTIAGHDETHLDAVVATLRAAGGPAFDLGRPQVAYREAITGHAVHDATFKGPLAGTPGPSYARVKFGVEPLHHGSGFVFLNGMAADSLSPDFAAAIAAGLRAALAKGPVAGFPVVDLRVLLIEASFHETHSSPEAFQKAAETGLREALKAAAPVLTEPLMMVTVSLPVDEPQATAIAGRNLRKLSGRELAELLMVRIAADLETRRGTAKAWTQETTATIEAETPLATLFGFAARLRELSGGRASFATRFARYAPVPSTDDPALDPAMAMRRG